MYKTANLTRLSKLRSWDPFLSFTFVYRKSDTLQLLADLSSVPSFFDYNGGPVVSNRAPKAVSTFFKTELFSFFEDTVESGGLN